MENLLITAAKEGDFGNNNFLDKYEKVTKI